MNNYIELRKLQPPNVRKIKEFDEIAKGQSIALDKLDRRIDRIYNNSFFISLELDEIEKYEKRYGLKPLGSLEDRRSAITAYRIGKRDKLSSTRIKLIAAAYENGEVEVKFDKEARVFRIKFVSVYGIPSGINKLKEILEDLKPSRLMIEYSLKYLLIKDIREMTLNQLQEQLINKFSFGEEIIL